jgi:hypothetical protein
MGENIWPSNIFNIVKYHVELWELCFMDMSHGYMLWKSFMEKLPMMALYEAYVP